MERRMTFFVYFATVKMTVDDYCKIAREPKETKHIPRDILEKVYYEIKQHEIKIPEENPHEEINGKKE
jgi:Sec7-like guanine-nucleotide exchange factor